MVLFQRMKAACRARHRAFVLDRCMRRFLGRPSVDLIRDDRFFDALVYGWNNPTWGAAREYVVKAFEAIESSEHGAVECGSGLTTLLLGGYAASVGLPYVALEHHEGWGGRVADVLERHDLHGVRLLVRPLRDTGSAMWYDVDPNELPDRIDLVLCDGPPGSTPGGRNGVLDGLSSKLEAGTVVLLDDADRDSEARLVAAFERIHGATTTFGQSATGFARLVLSKPNREMSRGNGQASAS